MLAAGLDRWLQGSIIDQAGACRKRNRNPACQPWQAVDRSKGSELIRKALGERAFHAFIESRNTEWNEYRAQVTKRELDKYLPVL